MTKIESTAKTAVGELLVQIGNDCEDVVKLSEDILTSEDRANILMIRSSVETIRRKLSNRIGQEDRFKLI